MKIAKVLINIVSVVVIIYLGVFALWLLMGYGCLQYVDNHGWQDNECGNDTLSQVIRTTHAPIVRLLVNYEK